MVSITFIPSWRVRKSSVAILFLSFFAILTACEDPQEIGSEVFAQNIGVLYTDTLTVDVSTVLLDSVSTSNTVNLLVGRYTDPVLGLVQASSYFHIVNNDTLRSVVDTAGRKDVKWTKFPTKIDSIRFILPYSTYQGDTLQTQMFQVHQLADNAILDVNKTHYSNTEAPALKPTLLGQTKSIKIRPVKNKNILSGTDRFDALRIPISDPTFIDFISKQRDAKKEDVVIGTEFRSKIRGLALTSESSNNAALLGFSSDFAVMKVYYSYKYSYTLRNKANTADSITVKVDTTKANDLFVTIYNRTTGAPINARFNKITTTRSGAFSKLLKSTDAVKSSVSNNEVAIQESAGLALNLKFPTLAKLKERQDIAINKAELVLEPKSSAYSVPQDLILIESTKDNRPVRTTTTGEGSLLFVSSEAASASYIAKTQNYTFNVTSSLQNVLSGRNKSNGWILTPTAFVTNSQGQRGVASGKNILSPNVDRAIFDAKKIKLKVYYTYVGK
jgi:Domain of unknown function (DUF4270)